MRLLGCLALLAAQSRALRPALTPKRRFTRYASTDD
eukprot:CAMPEP_0119279106 /NCGR_PEP_ID=MMETSP1329-20130426/20239_1 /TAXON_ID=114041 /ORGANISM="Genus nov. species nov., Strain RCC1024" /LENGTH=35 /DNA_ID= /DNA_START= /DNA_END= /DNA_ORIENTATION=